MINVYNVLLNEDRLPYLVKEKGSNQSKIATKPEQIVETVNSIFHAECLAEEKVLLVCLDTKCHINGLFEVSHGTVNLSLMQPREIFLRVLLTGGSGFIIVHNHPSGEPTPSSEDWDVTKKVLSAANIMGVRFLDHIIIGNGAYFSFNEDCGMGM